RERLEVGDRALHLGEAIVGEEDDPDAFVRRADHGQPGWPQGQPSPGRLMVAASAQASLQNRRPLLSTGASLHLQASLPQPPVCITMGHLNGSWPVAVG